MSGESYVEYVTKDLLARVDGVRARAMFGGYGLYKNSVMFGLIADEALYFKVDDRSRPDYEKAGSRPFSYEASGRAKPVVMRSYWEVPADVQEDPAEVARWVERSCRVAAAKNSRARSSGG